MTRDQCKQNQVINRWSIVNQSWKFWEIVLLEISFFFMFFHLLYYDCSKTHEIKCETEEKKWRKNKHTHTNTYDSMNIEHKQMNKNNFMMNLVFTHTNIPHIQ